MPVGSRPTLHLTVGLPGVGKTTLARELERAGGALRLTPDEWMVPLFGLRWADSPASATSWKADSSGSATRCCERGRP